MSLKIDSYQMAMFLRKTVGIFLTVFLFFEAWPTSFALATPISENIGLNTPQFYINLAIVFSFTVPLLRLIFTIPIATYQYSIYELKKEKQLILPQEYKTPLFKLSHQIIIVFIISLFIIIFPISLSYINKNPPKSIKDFLGDLLDHFIFTSFISLSTIIYSLQFFWKNIALTWVINILLLIFPIGTIFYYICLFIWFFILKH